MNAAASQVLAWPLWLWLLHGSLAAAVIASFVTHEGGGIWHEGFGYAALALAALRVLLGLKGTGAQVHPQTLIAGWLHKPADTWRYAVAHFRGRAPRHIGHNPLGGWMMVLLHVAGAPLASRLQRENLIAAMVHVKTRAPAPGDVP